MSPATASDCKRAQSDLVVSLSASLKHAERRCRDPRPRRALRYLLADAAPRVVLTQQDVQLPVIGVPALLLGSNELREELLAQPAHNPSVPGLHARHLAYVIYTSGSTGTPKGVMVDHRCVNRLVINNPYFEATAGDCFAHCANPASTPRLGDLWRLLNGARLLVVPSSVAGPGTAQRHARIERGALALWLTVGLFNQYSDHLHDAFGQLRYLLVGGDASIRRRSGSSCRRAAS